MSRDKFVEHVELLQPMSNTREANGSEETPPLLGSGAFLHPQREPLELT